MQDVVEWKEWLEGFRKYLKVSASQYKDNDPVIASLKLLLCTTSIYFRRSPSHNFVFFPSVGDSGSDSVTLDAWGNVLQWFGPLDPEGTAFLASVTNVTSKACVMPYGHIPELHR